MVSTLLPVVEGDGEVEAVPSLLRRICWDVYGRWDVGIRTPWRVPRGRMVKPDEMNRVYTVLSAGAAETDGGVLVILDQDDDVDVGALIETVSNPMAGRAPLEVAVASREFEAWFLGGIAGLRAHRSVKDDAKFLGDPDSPRNAKGALEREMLEHYRETLHQSSFCSLFSISDAQANSASFRSLVLKVGRLLEI